MKEVLSSIAGQVFTFTDTQVEISAPPKIIPYERIIKANCGMMVFEVRTANDEFIRYCPESKQKKRLKELTKHILKDAEFFKSNCFTQESFANVSGIVISFRKDGIVEERENQNGKLISYDRIDTIKDSNGLVTIQEHDGVSTSFIYKKEDSYKITPIISHISNHINSASPNKEYRMRCNVCGHVFCYTKADVEQNKYHMRKEALHLAGSALGNEYSYHEHTKHANAERSQIIDFSQCPKCSSKNTTYITDSSNTNTTQTIQPTSTADELKKFKELLDMGVITKEEFEAKKKQLLRL